MRASVLASLFVIGLIGLGLRAHQHHSPFLAPAAAQEPTPPAPPVAPKPPRVEIKAPGVVIRMGSERSSAPLWKAEVTGEFQTSPAAARTDALKAASRELAIHLRTRFPGYRYDPTPRFLEDQRMVDAGQEEKQVIEGAADAPVMQRHKLTVELREGNLSQLLQEDRRERSVERLWQAGRGLGGLLVALLALVGYVRLDDWTKGYFSLPLKLTALAIAVAGPVALWWLI